jgi:hypothetical protein
MVAFKRKRKDEAPRDADPTTPLDLPAVEPLAPPPELTASTTSTSVRDASGVAEVIGPTAIPQIIVGSPSPPVEPSTIVTGYRSLPFRPDVVIDGWSPTP